MFEVWLRDTTTNKVYEPTFTTFHPLTIANVLQTQYTAKEKYTTAQSILCSKSIIMQIILLHNHSTSEVSKLMKILIRYCIVTHECNAVVNYGKNINWILTLKHASDCAHIETFTEDVTFKIATSMPMWTLLMSPAFKSIGKNVWNQSKVPLEMAEL
jgi:hypothetical protein